MANKLFSDLVSFSRGTGATRVNAAGLIVGVDFSATSNTIATGSKTFTIAADANVNRDWAVNSSVIAVAQAGATGSMTGTVTSYTPSTQALVINVTSATGSGTSTDWRIGSLEMREDYDPVTLVRRGVLSEVAATNLLMFSEAFENAAYVKQGASVTANIAATPAGLIAGDKIVEDTSTGNHLIYGSGSVVLGLAYVGSVYLKKGERTKARLRTLTSLSDVQADFDLSTGTITAGASIATMTSVGNDWYRCSIYSFATATAATGRFYVYTLDATGAVSYTGDGTSGLFTWGAQLEQASFATSYIPTTTAQVTRSADNFPLTAAAVTAIRQGEGTLYAEIDCPDTGIAQKRALRLTGTNADIRIGKQGVGTLSNFTKMTEGAGLRLMGTSTSLIRGNGQDMVGVTTTDQRTGLPYRVTVATSVAFDGANRFAYTEGTGEAYIDAALGVVTFTGTGGVQFNGGHHNGNRFIVASSSIGLVLLSDGTSYRLVSTPAITQGNNEVTSGLVGGTLRNVIVGVAGFIGTSDDNGETWTARTSGTTTAFNAVAFGAGTFVAVNNTAANSRFSTDGIAWAAVTGLTGAPSDVVFTGSQFVVINNVGGVFTSTNGQAFTAVTTTGISPAFSNALGITFSNGFYVIVGNNGQVAISQAAANASPTTWTTFVTAQTGTGNQLFEVLAFNGAFYAVGVTQTVLRFTQSLTPTFSLVSAGVISTALVGIAASPTTLLISGTNGAIASSTDGATFTSRSSNAQVLNGIAFGNGTFVSVGSAVNGSGYIATIAADGTVTRRVSGSTGNINNVRFLEGAFYAISTTSGQSSMSTDGVTWTLIPSINLSTSNDIAFGNGVYLVIRGAVSNALRRSTDGINFEVTASPTSTTRAGVAFANGLFVIVGLNGFIETTPDGITFTQRTSGTTQTLNSVMFSTRDNLWYAAGNAGTLLYSPDAITWTAVQNSGTASILGTTLQSNQPLPQFKSGVNKIALSYKQNQVIAALNGVASSAVTTATIPSITAASIAENLNGYIKDVAIYKEALTTAEMTARTL